jgi:hypothetical protein
VPPPRGPPIEAPPGEAGGARASAAGGGVRARAGRPPPAAPPLDAAVVGGSNATASGDELGTGLLVGAGAFTSGSGLNALGLVFLRLGGHDKTEL